MKADITLVMEIVGRKDLIQLGGILTDALKDGDEIEVIVNLRKGGNNEKARQVLQVQKDNADKGAGTDRILRRTPD